MRIAGVGCALADFVYDEVDFSGEAFARLRSRNRGDGGIEPGRLVFLEAFEKFAGIPWQEALKTLVGQRQWDTLNVGGPAIVALIQAAQLLAAYQDKVAYYGVVGDDEIGADILDFVRQTPLNIEHYNVIAGTSPFTMVLSDPNYDQGHGERAFVNNIGASWHYGPEDIPGEFFDNEIILFGATALVPQLHDNLTELVLKAHSRGAVTVVSTVFDFRNEKKNPGGQWPLGRTKETFQYTDLFVADREEALRISGCSNLEDACRYYIDLGASAFVITNGPEPVTYYSGGKLFQPVELATLPVSQMVGEYLQSNPDIKGDTTGCGDNFAGGVLASLASQLKRAGHGNVSLSRAVAVGICTGGAARFHLGGIAVGDKSEEKLKMIGNLYRQYRIQIKDIMSLPEDLLDTGC